MIISERYGFLFVANLRTASTSIHRALRPLGNVVWRAPSGRKHAGIAEVYRVLGTARVAPLFKWAVIRDPVGYLASVYAYHQGPGFVGSPASTGGVSFEEFCFGERHAALTIPQCARFVDPDGAFALDLLLPFESVREGFSYLKFRLGLPNLLLPVTNRSRVPPVTVTPEAEAHIRSRYEADYRCRQRFAGRERVGDHFVQVLAPPDAT